MSPRPRRDLTLFVTVLAVGAVTLFLVVGGLASVGRSSGPYHLAIDRSFAAAAGAVAERSNTVGHQLDQLVSAMPGLQRAQLAADLDTMVTEMGAVETLAEQIGPTPGDAPSVDFLSAMAARAAAVSELRASVDGLLAITPGTGDSVLPPPSLTTAGADRALRTVGRLLSGADRTYRAGAKALEQLPGSARLPRSVWVSNPVLWGAGAVQALVEQLSSAPALAPQVDVVLSAVSLDPAVLPPAPPGGQALPAGVQAVPPTCTLSVTAVVRNAGSVAALDVPVRASVQPATGAAPFVVEKRTTLGPDRSVALALPTLAVSPGTTYGLTVTLDPPAGQAGPVGQLSATILVAPAATGTKNLCARSPVAAP